MYLPAGLFGAQLDITMNLLISLFVWLFFCLFSILNKDFCSHQAFFGFILFEALYLLGWAEL